MGVDIISHSGVVVTVDQLVQSVREDNREQACRALLRHTSTVLKALRGDMASGEVGRWDRREKQRQAALMIETFQELSIDSSVESMRTMLKHMTPVIDDNVVNSEEAIAIWANLIETLFPATPTPVSTEFIHSPRYQGWDLPKGEVLFVFSEDDCFERVKTQSGKALDQMIGEPMDLSSWTTYSV